MTGGREIQVADYPETGLALALYVTDPAQPAATVQAAEERFGGGDVLVNHAGYGYRASLDARRQLLEGCEDTSLSTGFAA